MPTCYGRDYVGNIQGNLMWKVCKVNVMIVMWGTCKESDGESTQSKCNDSTVGNMQGNPYVAVPGRNQTLFCWVFRPHYCLQSAVVQNFCWVQSSYKLHRLIRYPCMYAVCMSLAFDRSSALYSSLNMVMWSEYAIFDFYLGLQHIICKLSIKIL